MHRYTAYSLNFSSDIPLTECREANSDSDDFTIVNTRLLPPPLEPTNIHRRGVMAQTAIGRDGSLWLHWDKIATFKATGGRLLEVHPLTDNPDILSLFTVSEALGLLLFQRKYFLLHASAVKVGDSAWIFMGHPGAGKSTTCAAFVKAGCPLLSDDLTAIGFDENNLPLVLPAYPQLKIWENTVKGLGFQTKDLSLVSEGVNKYAIQPKNRFPSGPVVLSRMYFIHNEVISTDTRQMKISELPAETLKHFPMPNQFLSSEILKQYFHQSILCGTNAKVYLMKRKEGFESLEKWVNECLISKTHLPQ